MSRDLIAAVSAMCHGPGYDRQSAHTRTADADGFADATPVRDSTNPAGPALLFPTHAWQAFVTATAANGLRRA